MLSSSQLIEWLRRHDRRRARATKASRLFPPFAALLGVALAVLMARLGDIESASRLWLAVLIATTVLSFVTTPFRMFWSRDADVLARHPIGGRPLFRLGWVRNVRIAGTLALPPAIGLVGWALLGEMVLLPTHGVLLLAALAASVLLAPAVSLAAGSLAASDRADAIVRSVGGEFQPPRGAYLGVVPGVAGALVVLALIAEQPWAMAGSVAIPFYGSAVLVLSLLAIVAADARAAGIMPSAVRELSALNRRRLAHVEATRLSLVERISCALAPRGWSAIAEKDFRLLRRRYPAYFLVQAVAIVAAWVGATTSEQSGEWIAVVLCVLHAYSVLMLWRATTTPIEVQRLFASLPLGPSQRLICKLWPLAARTIVLTVTIGSALITATSWYSGLALVLVSAWVALGSGAFIARRRL